jgi:O-antigen biosynthesis protein
MSVTQARGCVPAPGVPVSEVPAAAVPAAQAPRPQPRDSGPRPGGARPRVGGKFVAVGADRLWVRGVTYGTFAPDAARNRFPEPAEVERDFAAMAAAGINAVRVYTVPPVWLLDVAADAGLWVMVGLAWEQHVTFLGHRGHARQIAERLRADVAALRAHPAVLAFAVGNEIPASIVRWHGRRRVERFLDRLCTAVHSADPEALVSYVNFPSSEYLSVPAADLVCFNIYLEKPGELAGYVARLHSIAGERPVVIGELGLDSLRHGLERQAAAVADQVRTVFDGGCAGAFVFAWTDEWHRGDVEVLDWDFGLTDRARRPKPALAAVCAALIAAPPAPPDDAPLVSVVICTYNGAATLPECLEGVRALDYPRVETIVVDDGSTDESAAISHSFGARVISTENQGLSAARNSGLLEARGQIVAYLDDDARPDPAWLTYLVRAFATTRHAAIGGPNIPPPDDTGVAACVANAPGGPVHVLLTDTEAEHLPGCNMAFRREALLAVGGFDPRFRVAGDDVDICWRLREQGMTLGFHAAAMVWHRRRGSVRRFWRQQRGYGKAEALLERKWPEKYNGPGHSMWAGRLYGRGTAWIARRTRVYHGTWGSAAFQHELSRPASRLRQLTNSPEWYLVLAGLAATSILGALWTPLLIALPLFVAATLAALANTVAGTRAARFGAEAHRARPAAWLLAVTLLLHLIQPAARLRGRLANGLAPWRRPDRCAFVWPTPRRRAVWSERWTIPEARLRAIAARAAAHGTRVLLGGATDRWDLEVRGGPLGRVRIRAVTEEHGSGRQLHRVRIVPRIPPAAIPMLALLAAAGTAAAASDVWVAAGVLISPAVGGAVAAVSECGIATATALRALDEYQEAHG